MIYKHIINSISHYSSIIEKCTCTLISNPKSRDEFLFSSRNDESLRRLGDTLSATSRQMRAKRINVNLMINVLAYVVEVIGGLIICAGASFGRMLYPIAVWYGLVVPSCYLVNNDDTKMIIMRHGWTSALRTLFATKQSKETVSTSTTDKVETQNDEQVDPRAPTSDKGPGNKMSDKKSTKGHAFQRPSKSDANKLEITSPSIGVFHISGNLRIHPEKKIDQKRLPLFHPRSVSYLGRRAACKNAGDVIVIDL